MIKFNPNYYDNISPPPYILCKANGDRLGSIKCTEKTIITKFNDYDEISFTTNLFIDNEKNIMYDKVKELQYIELPEIGRFIISQVDEISEGTEYESKECTALSAEVTLAQKYLEVFTINMGTVESIDGVSLYNLGDPLKSLIHLVLEKCPDWKIGHIDTELITVQRCFEIDRCDVYSFLTSNIEQAFECIVIFDTLRYEINIYAEKNVGQDTNIFVSYNNLLKNTNISFSDEIKTCVTVTGADDLNLREVNMGYDRIYLIDYFHNLEYMSQGLYDAYTLWKKKWNDNVKPYEALVTQYQAFYTRINYLRSEKMPDDPKSTDWTLYGLNPLKEKLDSYKATQALMMKAGRGNVSHKDYQTSYVPCCNTIAAIESQIIVVENEIKGLESQQSVIGKQMDAIISDISIPNNFTKEQYDELSKWIREDEFSSDNYVVTDSMTDSERMDMLHDMLEYAQRELEKIAQPNLTFTADMANIFAIEEFNNTSLLFNPGNYIHIGIRDDYIVKARLLTMTIDFFNAENFSVTFGNIMKKKDTGILADVTDALKLAASASTTVSMNSSNWNKANKDANDIGKMLADGLLNAGNSIHTSHSDVQIDDRGIFITNMPDSQHPLDGIFLGNSQILFSDDGFRSIKTALGRIQYTKKGVTYNDFGLLAQFVIAGYVAGSVVEGTEIIGGTITGSDFNNGNGTFHVDKDGKLVASSANITGNINANTGTIGGSNGFTITSGKLYSGGKSSLNSASTGVYVGTDGISLGANSPFKVTPDGKLISTSGTIGGWTVDSNKLSASGIEIYSGGYLRATNGNWRINADGTATFKNVYISGVQNGSTFGNISHTANGTYGNFNNGFYAGTSFGLTGGALSNFDNLVCRNITAENIRATNVLADYITANTVAANYATIGRLETAEGRIGTIESNYITAGTVAANYATITSLNTVNGRFDSIDAGSIKTGTMSVNRINFASKGVDWLSLQYVSSIESTEETIGGKTFLAVHKISINHLYTLGRIT